MDEFSKGAVYYLSSREFASRGIRNKIRKIDKQIKNTKEDIKLLQKTEKSLQTIEKILFKMRELALIAANDESADKAVLNEQLQELKKDIRAVVFSADYKGVNLTDGSLGDIGAIISAIGAVMQ